MSGSILDREPPPADQRLAYGDAPQHVGDLRLPAGARPHPAIVVIHGGFWRARYDLRHTGHLCAALTAAGFATWNVEYRRLGDPGGGWPGTFRDAARAARFLVDNAPAYGIDPVRVLALGHSAGGHLALWLAGLGKVPAGSPVAAAPLPLAGAVALAGVVDLERAWALGLSDGVVGDLLGGAPAAVAERYAAASPARLLPLGVPHLLVHGTADDIVPYAIGADYQAAALAAGDDARLLPLPGAGHFEPIDPEAAPWPAILDGVRSLVASAPS